MKKMLCFLFLGCMFFLAASEEDICSAQKIISSKEYVVQQYDTPLLKKPLTLFLSAKQYTIVYGNQVFTVPEEIAGQIFASDFARTYVSCEAGYPQVGGYTISLHIPASRRGLLDPWYQLAMNAKGFSLSLKHGDKTKRTTENLIPFDQSIKVAPVPLSKWQEKYPLLANKSVQAGSPFIRFQLVSAETENRLAERTVKAPPTGMEWIQDHQTGEWILLEQESWEIPSVAEVLNDESKDMPLLLVSLYPEDAKRFYELTQKYIGRRLAVFVLGDYCCSPVILAPIQDGRIQMTGVANRNEVLENFKLNVKKNHPTWQETIRRDENNSIFSPQKKKTSLQRN